MRDAPEWPHFVMKKWFVSVGCIIILLAAWAYAVTALDMNALQPGLHNVVFDLPCYSLVLLGCYALSSIGYELATLADIAEDGEKLKLDIERVSSKMSKYMEMSSSD